MKFLTKLFILILLFSINSYANIVINHKKFPKIKVSFKVLSLKNAI